jgi:4-hydroxymandelate oxidase
VPGGVGVTDRAGNATVSPADPAGYALRAAELLPRDVHDWFAGGAGGEHTLRDNEAAFRRWRLRPRVLAGLGKVTTATEVLGTRLELPVVVAPMAFQRLLCDDGEVAVARGAAAAGAGMCVPTLTTRSFADVAAAAPGAPQWVQLYHFGDRGQRRALVDAARAAGASALVLTVDGAVRGRREHELSTGFPLPAIDAVPELAAALDGAAVDRLDTLHSRALSWRDVDWLAREAGMPLLLKGILTAEDARLACESGAAGIVVSNHGGRQLDGVAAGIDALPEIAEAVGARLELLVDGGVRRAPDVAVALALGARAVMVGRPLAWALAAAGHEGVELLLRRLRDELETTLALLGCDRPGAVTRAHVGRAEVAS